MPYSAEQLDFPRLARYARHVSQARSTSPESTVATINRESVKIKRLFGSRTESRAVPAVEPVGGWILLVDPDEGQVSFVGRGGVDVGRFQGFEEGRLILLSRQGELVCCRYSIHIHRPIVGAALDKHELTDRRAATSDDVVSFDRLNRAEYREVANRDRGRNRAAMFPAEAWRRELGRNWRVRVPHPGMEVSRALKTFKDAGSYIHQLEIGF